MYLWGLGSSKLLPRSLSTHIEEKIREVPSFDRREGYHSGIWTEIFVTKKLLDNPGCNLEWAH